MNARCHSENSVGWQGPISEWDSIISRTGMFRKWKIGTYTWRHPDRIRKSAKSQNTPTFGERSIEGTLRMEEMARNWATRTCLKFQGFYSAMRHEVFQTESREQCFFTSYENFETENWFIVDSGACPRMMSKSGLTTEEQDTILNQRIYQFLFTTANGTTHRARRSNRKCHWFGHVCWCSVTDRITRGTFTG